MDVESKLRILADAAKYDTSCASSGSTRKRQAGGIGNGAPNGICHSFTPDGRCVSLLKILLTNYCIYDCAYCINRISSDTPRARFAVDEVVRLTVDFYQRNYIEGLFLSSGVIQSPDYTMEQIVGVARTLRTEHAFGGYIHLKGVPGASRELLREAGLYADRLSVNIELCSQYDLDRLAPAKQHSAIEESMTQIVTAAEEVNDGPTKPDSRFAPAGQTTQMIVGATPASDRDILTKASDLYTRHGLRRVYYSAFSPIPHAHPILPVKAPPLMREHRLYQADWLMRYYGFRVQEVASAPNLRLDMDPKLAWALQHRERFPVDVNCAPREMLLRVPGFGVRNVDRILRSRKFRTLTLDDLARLRIPVKRSEPFIVTATSVPRSLDSLKLEERFLQPAEQMSLFAPLAARTGEL